MLNYQKNESDPGKLKKVLMESFDLLERKLLEGYFFLIQLNLIVGAKEDVFSGVKQETLQLREYVKKKIEGQSLNLEELKNENVLNLASYVKEIFEYLFQI